ncbi:MAG: hypothetical protein HC845_13605 [Akkermansiaceae bacterium]|nr:hypothetical protein [Akkermansiaceae bacterium]
MAIGEGESSNVAEDYLEYVVQVAEIKDGKTDLVHVIRGNDIKDLEGEKLRTFKFPNVPFDLQVTHYQPNVVPVSAAERAPDQNQPIADGYFLMENPSSPNPKRPSSTPQVATLEFSLPMGESQHRSS